MQHRNTSSNACKKSPMKAYERELTENLKLGSRSIKLKVTLCAMT